MLRRHERRRQKDRRLESNRRLPEFPADQPAAEPSLLMQCVLAARRWRLQSESAPKLG